MKIGGGGKYTPVRGTILVFKLLQTYPTMLHLLLGVIDAPLPIPTPMHSLE